MDFFPELICHFKLAWHKYMYLDLFSLFSVAGRSENMHIAQNCKGLNAIESENKTRKLVLKM